MAVDVDGPGGQFRTRRRRFPTFRRKGELHLSERRRGRVFGEVRFEFSNLQLSNVDLTFRSRSVRFANLVFEDCSFESGSSGSIVEVENCASSRIRGTIQFHHVSFGNNTLIGGSGLAMQSPSCFELELIDFVMESITCDGHCGVILSRWNRLRDVIVRQNEPADAENTNTAVFYAPPGSETSVDHMNSSANRCSSLEVEDGSLNMTETVFVLNSFVVSRNDASSSSLRLNSATASMKECEFRQNSSPAGGAIEASRSNVTFTDSIFAENVAIRGGVMVLRDDNIVSIQSCRFLSNRVSQRGGAIAATESRLFVTDSFLANNLANITGGCIFLDDSSDLTMSFTVMNNNQASYGGAFALEGNASGRVTNSSFHMNTAYNFGGAIHVDESLLSVQQCNLTDGSAGFGGGIHSSSSDVSVENVSASGLSAGEYGGFLFGTDSEMRMKHCALSNNVAGSGGGALRCESDSRCTDTGSNYSSNAADFGGAVYLQENASGSITNCQFDKNTASRSGGAMYIQRSMLSVKKCTFTNGSADSGGAVYSHSSNIALEDASYYSDNVARFGGAISLTGNSLGNIADCEFVKNTASRFGGAAYVELSMLSVQKCHFTNGSAEHGGGLFSIFSNISVKDASHYSSNAAKSGGAVYVEGRSSGNITDCQFEKNNASTDGGAVYIRDSVLLVQKCHFTDGSAEFGGAIYSSSSNISIRKTEALRMSANKNGGAILFSNSVFRISNTQISQCEAETDGGAIMGYNSSRLLCNGCTLVGNKATRGGAIFFQYSDTQSISLQLDNSNVFDNSAEYGGICDKANRNGGSPCCTVVGGIQIVAETESTLQKCLVGLDECRVAAMTNTSMIDNKAQLAGGAVFIDTAAGFRLNCSAESTGRELEFYAEKRWDSMKRLTSTEEICTSWENNSADRYGPVVATSVSDVQKDISDKETGLSRLVNGTNYTVHNHRSGEPIPMIVLTAVDELGQSPAVGENNKDIEAMMSSPDGFFIGRVIEPLGVEGASLSAAGFVQPGNYRILIIFEGADLESFEITVEVKPCDIGEVTSRNGTLCVSCNAVSFNFYPKEDLECHPCPANGDCSSQVIMPERGYWHRTPCSEHIQRCLTEEACDSDSRENTLAELTQDVQTCQFDDQYLQDYTEAQCREVSIVLNCGLPQVSLGSQGHEGPLCGSCKESYGKSHSHLCEECRSDGISVVLVVLSFLVLLGLASITVRSNLLSAYSSQQQTQCSQFSAASTSTRAVPAERRIEMTVVEAITEGGSTPDIPQEADPVQSSEDAELAKWKAVELFKVTLSLLPTVSIRPDCAVDHSELSAGHRHSDRC